jgi:transcriptional/translational regulatory protein YebC/TACO1
MVSENLVPITDLNDAKAVLRILEALEDNDDVQDVFSNFDITDELMESAAS